MAQAVDASILVNEPEVVLGKVVAEPGERGGDGDSDDEEDGTAKRHGGMY